MPRFTSHDGTILAYHPRGEGEPLICLPGGAGRASSYPGDLGGLAVHRRLVLLDNRGTGESDEPEDPATYRRDLAALTPAATYAEQPGAGHFPWVDDPRRLVDRVTAWQTAT